MAADQNVSELVKAIIQTQVIQALNNAPDAVEKLVKSALEKPVDAKGVSGSYGSTMPYLDFIVGEEIRHAAESAVRKIIQDKAHLIEESVRAGLTTDTVVAAVTKSFVDAAKEDWRIKVSFEAAPKSRY